MLYMQHTNNPESAPEDVIDRDSSVHWSMANVLKIEGKHHDALVNVLYWAAGAKHPTKKQQQQLGIYFRRCKFKNVDLAEAESIRTASGLANYSVIQAKVQEWKERG